MTLILPHYLTLQDHSLTPPSVLHLYYCLFSFSQGAQSEMVGIHILCFVSGDPVALVAIDTCQLTHSLPYTPPIYLLTCTVYHEDQALQAQ